MERREGVDDRDKPGQGDLEFVPGLLQTTDVPQPDSREVTPAMIEEAVVLSHASEH